MSREESKRVETLRAIARETLETLVLERAEIDEKFAVWLDTRLIASLPQRPGTPLDPVQFRHHADVLLSAVDSGTSRRHWDEWGTDVDEAELEELVGTAAPFLAAGQGADALVILKSVAEALVDYWPKCAQWDETLHEFFPQLDSMIAQAVLMNGVSQETRDDLSDDLSNWQDEVAEYGSDDTFSTAIAACLQGWDEPGLEEALAGQVQGWPLGGRGDLMEDALMQARLAAFDSMGRTPAYLNLSLAGGFYCEHAVKLTQTGRVDEAVAFAHARLTAPQEILRLAEALETADRLEASLDLAAWGLSLPARGEDEDNVDWRFEADRISLARWLREAALEAGRRDIMLSAARVAFEESLAREDFRLAEKLAGPVEWPQLRETLLAALLAAPHAHERIEILLDEDMIDAAVACVDLHERCFLSPRDRTLLRLAEEAFADHPDWTIALAFRVADPIMDEGRSTDYETAAEWLGIAARAHAAGGRSEEWDRHLEERIETHRRKYTLRPLLEALRHAAG